MAGASLSSIYDRLRAAPSYHPLSAETYADWSMEAGDIVTVSREGVEYTTPVHQSTLKWRGSQQITINSDGDKERPPLSKMSQKKYASTRSGGGGCYGQQQLFYDMESEDGIFHATISATAERLQTDYSKKIEDVDDALSTRITQTAEGITTEVNNRISGLATRVEQTENSVGLAVGRLKYSMARSYTTKSKFPKTGNSTVLYYDQTEERYYVWNEDTKGYIPATIDQRTGEATFIKTGEIAIAFNKQTRKTEARLDADVVYVGRGATTLKDLNLPDWMDTTSGLIATKATIADLNALRARVRTLEADAITTKTLSAKLSVLKSVLVSHVAAVSITSDSLKFSSLAGMIQTNVASGYCKSALTLNSSTNVYTLTLYKFNGKNDTLTFSRATSLSGKWSGKGVYTVTASPQKTTHVVTLSNITKGSISWASNKKGFTQTLNVYAKTGSSASVQTGYSKSLWFDASDAYDAGYSAGASSAGSYSKFGNFTKYGSVSVEGQTYMAYITNDTSADITNVALYRKN